MRSQFENIIFDHSICMRLRKFMGRIHLGSILLILPFLLLSPLFLELVLQHSEVKERKPSTSKPKHRQTKTPITTTKLILTLLSESKPLNIKWPLLHQPSFIICGIFRPSFIKIGLFICLLVCCLHSPPTFLSHKGCFFIKATIFFFMKM